MKWIEATRKDGTPLYIQAEQIAMLAKDDGPDFTVIRMIDGCVFSVKESINTLTARIEREEE
jgi:uncharacterized protein YlzI (FlbEa/FlbD family)